MCGRFSQTANQKKLSEEFGIPPDSIPPVRPRRHIVPLQPVAALVKRAELKIDFFLWGLIPVWAKDAGIGKRMFNARSESLAVRPSFRGLFQSQRCLVLADGFYEWKKEGANKIPYYIRLKSGKPFGFAGLWSHWLSRDGSEIKSCTVITCTPNALIQKIHHRMPVIISAEDRGAWLDILNHDTRKLFSLLKSYPAEEMEAYPAERLELDTPKDFTDIGLKKERLPGDLDLPFDNKSNR